MKMSYENNELNTNKIKVLMEEFDKSDTLKWMNCGQKYYEIENDILSKPGKKSEFKSDNRIAHAKYKEQVDEKVSYLLAKEPSFTSDDETYLKSVTDVLQKCKFNYHHFELGYEASNKGIGWAQVYIDEDGGFGIKPIPSEQCIPVWEDGSHTTLKYMIRRYSESTWIGDSRKTITVVEVWSKDSLTVYRYENKVLVLDESRSIDENGEYRKHYHQTIWKSWERVPFIPFKNNRFELPDIKSVKSLIDEYDKSRSESANYVDDLVNYLVKVFGYSETERSKVMSQLKEHILMFDDKEDGGLEIETPNTNIQSIKEHSDQVKRDLTEDGQSVNKDLDKFGSAPSGITLKFLYSGLELKANLMAREFKNSFEQLLYFINHYLNITNTKITEYPVNIEFNVDMKTDETETIQNCINSQGVISDETIITNHPWSKDGELDKLKAQQKENDPFKDKVPILEKSELDEK